MEGGKRQLAGVTEKRKQEKDIKKTKDGQLSISRIAWTPFHPSLDQAALRQPVCHRPNDVKVK